MNTLNLAQSLELHFGFTEFRAGQQQTIQQLIQGFSSLAIFPTGAGKSLCYQLAATQLPHLTLVVSPLIALMKDQLEFLKSKNISAAMVDASLTPQQSQQILQDVRDNKVKVLMVSVERFKNERFRQFISGIQISMLVVDEAHCISEWGHNFRPDYLKLPQYQQQLNIPLVLLLTATATASVKQDMVKKFDINSAHVVQTGFYRANLNIAIEAVASSDKPGRLKQVLLLEAEHGPKAGIIYVTLQKTAETLAAYLQTSGINACAYHAGLSDEKRGLIQQQFMRDDSRVEVIVATIAFGMGIDKANIRFVIHYDLPKSIENYSQEIGRAGRDGESANCYTLANLDNLCTLENFIYGDTPERTGIETVIESIKELTVNQHWETQVYTLSNLSNIRQLTLKTLLVQLELMGVLQAKFSYFAEFKLKLLVEKADILALFDAERRDFIQNIFGHTDFKRLWGVLNFDDLHQAYGCDRARVIAALEYLAQKQLIEVQTSQMTEVYWVNHGLLMNPKLAADLDLYFKHKEQKEIKRIQELVSFFEQENCMTYNLACYFDDQAIMQKGFMQTKKTLNCGHCCACQGKTVVLEPAAEVTWPMNDELLDYLAAFNEALIRHQKYPSIELSCRFLAGISLPVFTKIKARQLSGFGCCDRQRYTDIKRKIEELGL